MVMHWNEYYEESEIIEVWTSMAIMVAKRFFKHNYTSFSIPLPLFITPTKRAIKGEHNITLEIG